MWKFSNSEILAVFLFHVIWKFWILFQFKTLNFYTFCLQNISNSSHEFEFFRLWNFNKRKIVVYRKIRFKIEFFGSRGSNAQTFSKFKPIFCPFSINRTYILKYFIHFSWQNIIHIINNFLEKKIKQTTKKNLKNTLHTKFLLDFFQICSIFSCFCKQCEMRSFQINSNSNFKFKILIRNQFSWAKKH